MNLYQNIFYLLLSISLYTSCTGDKVEIPDVDDVIVDFEINRYDQKILNIDTLDTEQALLDLQKDNPKFFELYFKNVLPLRGENMTELAASLKGFLGTKQIQELKHNVEKSFPDFDGNIGPEIEQAFKYYSYYFPQSRMPDIYTVISEYAYQTFIFPQEFNDGIGIGLDLYLGKNFPYQQKDPHNEAFSNYLIRSYNRDHIVKKVMEQIITDKLENVRKNQLLDYMIQNGKKLYILDKVLPEYNDTIIMEFSEKDWEWVNNNEVEMFAFFLKEELFYESDNMKINKYINPSPDSPGMPPAAPGRTANFIGWKIVEAYMKQHPEMTFQELVDIKDAQKIMNESKYKPRRK